MKKLILNIIRITLCILLLIAAYGAQAQSIATIKSLDKVMGDTTIKDVKYPIYVGSHGGRYLIRTNVKTGNMYKQYLAKKKKTA